MVLQEFITGKLYLNWGFREGFTKEIMAHKCETELLTHEELGLGQEGKRTFQSPTHGKRDDIRSGTQLSQDD